MLLTFVGIDGRMIANVGTWFPCCSNGSCDQESGPPCVGRVLTAQDYTV